MNISKPPQTTIVFENLPQNAGINQWLMGIDTQFFNINKVFRGIKLIPSGVHLLHYSCPPETNDTTKDEISTESITSASSRYGFWFECNENDVLVVRWEEELERLVIVNQEDELEQLNYSKCLDKIGEMYTFMVSYPENKEVWFNNLTSCIDFEIILEFLPFDTDSYSGEVNTMMPSKEENMVLLDALERRDPQIRPKFEDQSNMELKYTIIQFKINKESGLPITDVTHNFLDKSWYLNQLYGNDLDLMLGELQLCFIQFIVLGNFCSGLQWLNILKLILMSKDFVESSQRIALNFLKVFQSQLETLPKEYLNDECSINNLIDLQTYVSVMENFATDIFPPDTWGPSGCCSGIKIGGLIKDKWHSILTTNKSKFNLDFEKTQANAFDENKIEVFDLENYDENDEDAPVILS